MAHNTLCSAMTKALNSMPKENSKTQKIKKQNSLLNPKTKIVCSDCGNSKSTLFKVKTRRGKFKYLCLVCKQKGVKKSENTK